MLSFGRAGLVRDATALAAGAALIALLACATAPAEAKVKTKTFSSGLINQPFSTVGGFVDSMRINRRGKIRDVNVGVRISHPDTTDLELSFRDASYSGAILSEHFPSDGPNTPSPNFGVGPGDCANDVFTVFDDQAPTHITQGTNPFAGSYNVAPHYYPGGGKPPVIEGGNPINGALKGRPLNQRFVLEVPATVFGNIVDRPGILHCWQLTIKYKREKRRKGKK